MQPRSSGNNKFDKPVTQYRRYDDMLLGQVYCTRRGSVIEMYGAMVK